MNTADKVEIQIHQTNLIQSGKYKINERIPKRTKDIDPLLPHCSNSYLNQLTKTWDKGSRQVRERILVKFVESMSNATGPQLEKELNNGASLLLTRISAWLRLNYLLGYDLALQLKALTIFVSAASGNRFLTEFLEVGGILTVLEILTITQAKEEDRAEALILLIKVATNGRKFKEFICVRQVTECLSKSKSEVTQDYARNLLVSLGVGNPRFQIQVYKGLQSLLSSSAVSPTAQQMSAQALRMLLTTTENAPTSLIDPASSLLRSQHMQVQYEGYELLRELVTRPNCQEQILTLLIAVLRNVFESQNDEPRQQPKDAPREKWANITSEDQKEKERLISGFIQQAYASKLIGVLIATSEEITEKLISNQLISSLLNVVANAGHHESQKYAVSNILFLVNKYDHVKTAIRKNMGENFYDLLENKPDTFYKELTKEQVRYLRRSNIKVKQMDGPEKDIDSESDSGSDSGEKKRIHTAFPGNQPEKEQVLVEEKIQPVVVESEVKLQQQVFIDQYEQTDTGLKKELVGDLYIQYQPEVGLSSTFPANKYIYNVNNDHVVFDNELEDFRLFGLIRDKNNKRKDYKKAFEPQLDDGVKSQLVSIREDAQLFSHDKMVATVQKHMDESGMRQMMSSDDQAMMMFETNLIVKGNEVDSDEEVEHYEEMPVRQEEEAFGVVGDDLKKFRGVIEIKDDWNLDEEVEKNSRGLTSQTSGVVEVEKPDEATKIKSLEDARKTQSLNNEGKV